jgi:hypothetical protein
VISQRANSGVLCGVEAQLASKKSEISVHGRTGLTRIRLQCAIYFCLHRGSLPENTAVGKLAKRHYATGVKYWEIIADNLSKAGWIWGCVSALGSAGRTIWIVDAHRDDGRRFVVRADEKLSAFVELESEVLTVTFYLESIRAGDQ